MIFFISPATPLANCARTTNNSYWRRPAERRTLESNHRPNHGPAGHRGEGVFHVVKADLARDHLIQPQRAVQIPAHEPREELGRDHVAAAARRKGDLLVEETAPGER